MRPDGPDVVMTIGVVALNRGSLRERAADLEAVHVRHLRVEDDHVGLGGAGPLKRLLPGVGAHDRVAARSEDALERSGGPLLVVGDQDQRGGGALSRFAIELSQSGEETATRSSLPECRTRAGTVETDNRYA